jgi:hypothetical protein
MIVNILKLVSVTRLLLNYYTFEISNNDKFVRLRVLC